MILRALRYVPPSKLFCDSRIFVEDAGLLSFIFGCFWLDSFPAAELQSKARSSSPDIVHSSMDRLVSAGYLERIPEDSL